MHLSDDELRAVRQKAKDAIDAAYWRFCRQARAEPPVLVVPEAYETVMRVDAEMVRRKEARR